MRKKDAHFLLLQGLSLNGVWICPENPRGECGLEKCRKLGPGLPTQKAQTDSRSCSVVLRLCSLVSLRTLRTARAKYILVGEASVHSTGLPHCPHCMVSRYLLAE